jgi:hypothetical protein
MTQGMALLAAAATGLCWSPSARAQSEASFPSGPEPAPPAVEHPAPQPSALPPPPLPPAVAPPAPSTAPQASTPRVQEAADPFRLPPDELASDNDVASADTNSAAASSEAFAPVAETGELPQSAEAGLSPLPARFWPNRLPYQEGDPVPSGYRVETNQSTGLIFGGGAVLGVAYAASVVAALGDDSKGSGWLLLPLVGPFGSILAQDVHCEATTASASDPTVVTDATESARECSKKVVSTARRVTVLLVDGLAQVAGGSLLVVGLSTRQRELVRDKALLLTPRLVGGSYGFDVWGQF